MRTLVILAVAGCVVPATTGGSGGEAGSPAAVASSATIYIQETFLLDGRIYTGFEASGPATARLMRGTTVLGELPASTGCHGVRDPRGLWSDDPRLDPDCSWPVADLAADHYAIEVAAGAVLARADFDLVAVPAAGATTALAVDPTVRSGAPYLRGDQLWVWWPIDARYAWRQVELHGFAGDTWRGATYDSIHGPVVRKAGDAAVTVDVAMFDLGQTHAVDAIVATAGRHVLGAWRPPVSPAITWTPIPVDDAMMSAVVAHGDARIQETTREYGVLHRAPMLARQMVARVCGAITSASTMALIEEIEDEVTPARWDSELDPSVEHYEDTPEYRGMIRKLDGKVAAFKKQGDCFARAFAAAPYLLPEPDPDEPDFRATCGPPDGCTDWSDARDPHWQH